MKLELKYKCVAGTDRGGEDVSLRVILTSVIEPNPETAGQEAEQAFEDWKTNFFNECCKGKDGEDDLLGESLLTDGDPPNGVVLTSDDRIKTFGSEYGFRIDEPADKVKQDVVRLATGIFDLEAEWIFGQKSRIWKIERDFYTDGNAD